MTRINVIVAGVASSIPAELTRQFSPLAKTTALESKINIAVAWADLILCWIGWALIRVVIPAALIGALIGLAVVGKKRGRW